MSYMKTEIIKKIGLLCLQDNKLLVVFKPKIGLYITPGGKLESGETDAQCLHREILEELGCSIRDIQFFETFQTDVLEQRCYLGNLEGKIPLNIHDSITSYCWIDRNYKELGITLAPMLEHNIIPSLIHRGVF